MKTKEEIWHLMMMNSEKEETFQIIEDMQKEAYNECLADLIKDDILPDKVLNFIKYKK